jgi:hypothetical protein
MLSTCVTRTSATAAYTRCNFVSIMTFCRSSRFDKNERKVRPRCERSKLFTPCKCATGSSHQRVRHLRKHRQCRIQTPARYTCVHARRSSKSTVFCSAGRRNSSNVVDSPSESTAKISSTPASSTRALSLLSSLLSNDYCRKLT